MNNFWQSFQGLLGPQGFQGFQAKDLFDNKRWGVPVPRGPEWQNPLTMRTPTNIDYIPRVAAKPGASLTTTRTLQRPPLRQINTEALARRPQPPQVSNTMVPDVLAQAVSTGLGPRNRAFAEPIQPFNEPTGVDNSDRSALEKIGLGMGKFASNLMDASVLRHGSGAWDKISEQQAEAMKREWLKKIKTDFRLAPFGENYLTRRSD